MVCCRNTINENKRRKYKHVIYRLLSCHQSPSSPILRPAPSCQVSPCPPHTIFSPSPTKYAHHHHTSNPSTPPRRRISPPGCNSHSRIGLGERKPCEILHTTIIHLHMQPSPLYSPRHAGNGHDVRTRLLVRFFFSYRFPRHRGVYKRLGKLVPTPKYVQDFCAALFYDMSEL